MSNAGDISATSLRSPYFCSDIIAVHTFPEHIYGSHQSVLKREGHDPSIRFSDFLQRLVTNMGHDEHRLWGSARGQPDQHVDVVNGHVRDQITALLVCMEGRKMQKCA